MCFWTRRGFEQEFNSLDAQREACAAYVASHKAKGWVLLPTVYEDGGISGGTLERPGPAALARRHRCWSRRAGGDLQGRPADPLSCRLCEARRTARDARPNRADLLAKFSRSVISKKDRSIDSIYFRGLTARANRSWRKRRKTPRMGQDAGSDLCFEVSSRDRIAPDCAIRHLNTVNYL